MTEISKMAGNENGFCDMEASNLMISSLSNSLSDYIVVGPLGRGAGSFVYKIRSRRSQRESVFHRFANNKNERFFKKALKVIDKKQSNFENVQKRLSNEIEINHKHIVKLLNNFEDSDNFYILLELCEGGELYTYLKSKGRLNEAEARKLTLQLAQAIHYLHSNMIIHRDLKLGNLLLTNNGDLKICDFGLAVKLIDSKPERSTICGTPNYISPEILNKEPYGMKSDCWSFGCILYALITGNPPFEGDSVQETLRKVKKSTLHIPSSISSELSDLLQNVINWDPHARFDINQILLHPFYNPGPTGKSVPQIKKPRYPLEDKGNLPCFAGSDNINKLPLQLSSQKSSTPSSSGQRQLNSFISNFKGEDKQIEKHREAIRPYIAKSKNSDEYGQKSSEKKAPPQKNLREHGKNKNYFESPENYFENKENYPESRENYQENRENYQENKEDCLQRKAAYQGDHIRYQEIKANYSENKSLNHSRNENYPRKQKENQAAFLDSKEKIVEKTKGTPKANGEMSRCTFAEGREKEAQAKGNFVENDNNDEEIQTFSPFIAKKNIVKSKGQREELLRENFFFQTPKLDSLNTSWETQGPESSRISYTLQSTSKKASVNCSLTSNILNNTSSKLNGLSSREFDFEACLALTPLCTDGLSPNKFKTKKGRIEIKKDLSIELELCEGKVLFCVQNDGYKISITKIISGDTYFKTYPLFQLPTKYHNFYTYARQITESLRSKTPRVKISNEFGKFMLMINSPFPNFEAHFTNGWRAIHKVSSDLLILTSPCRKRKIEININDSSVQTDPEVENMVDLTLNYLGVCIEEEQADN